MKYLQRHTLFEHPESFLCSILSSKSVDSVTAHINLGFSMFTLQSIRLFGIDVEDTEANQLILADLAPPTAQASLSVLGVDSFGRCLGSFLIILTEAHVAELLGKYPALQKVITLNDNPNASHYTHYFDLSQGLLAIGVAQSYLHGFTLKYLEDFKHNFEVIPAENTEDAPAEIPEAPVMASDSHQESGGLTTSTLEA